MGRGGGVAGGRCAQRASGSGTRFTGRWMVLGTAVTDRIVGTEYAIVYGSHREGPTCTYVMNYLSPRPSFAVAHHTESLPLWPRKVFISPVDLRERQRGSLPERPRRAPGTTGPGKRGSGPNWQPRSFLFVRSIVCSFPFFLPPRLPHPNRERPTPLPPPTLSP